METTSKGSYVGRLEWTPLPDGRLMELLRDFGFVDFGGEQWPVPAGARVDGASIPQVLWSLVGSPFTGKYRDASVIHDYYCDIRVRPWRAVHRVFFDAMIASDVNNARAKLMYAAVYFAGPRWSNATIHNNQLPRLGAESDHIDYYVAHSDFEIELVDTMEIDGLSARAFLASGVVKPPSGPEIKLHLDRLESLIGQFDPSTEEIASALDTGVDALQWLVPKERTLAGVETILSRE